MIIYLRSDTTVVPVNPCQPSPCGPNSFCKELKGQAICSCATSYVGSPPSCRPECVVSAECPSNKNCLNHKCVDPCVNTCGYDTTCRVINHNPICSCRIGYTGDPFSRCYAIPGNLINCLFKRYYHNINCSRRV